jgi:hypothetical protein
LFQLAHYKEGIVKVYRRIVDETAKKLYGRLVSAKRFSVETPRVSPRDLCGDRLNPHPRIVCPDETRKLLVAVLLNLSGDYVSDRWQAVSYRWLAYSTLTVKAGGRQARTILQVLLSKRVPFLEPGTFYALTAPINGSLSDFNRALSELKRCGEVEIISHHGEDFICPTDRIMCYVDMGRR